MILVIEDDRFKFDQISELLIGKAEVRWCRSVHSGVQALSSPGISAIILDMALPSHDLAEGGASPASLPSGGLEIIYELSYSNKLLPVIIITQYPEIEIEGSYVKIDRAAKTVRDLYQIDVVGVVHFKQNDQTWRKLFQSMIGRLA
ncbi:hypothetical protein [Rhizobium chutanense]|uniref:Response regulator n=1 Tax=Rhizobium chutanense TaxID=2035448 RepID=A0A432NDS5_9HYPH|nr:hypothetical protein [Rhizobium chutanense]RUL97745.1 hypothetical protein EFR84_30050 [Rhizobium chutanense]